jgi:Zn-dependent protease with chaperone function
MILQPFAYHRRAVEFLETNEPELWSWFNSDDFEASFDSRARLAIEKSAIRLGRTGNAANAKRYELADQVRDKLGLDAEVVLYQAQDAHGSPNASLYYIPGQITIEFAGRILELLDDVELLDLIGHEVAHYKLYQDDGGIHLTAVRLLSWIESREDALHVWSETARRLSLYTEIYCDTAGYFVTDDRDAAVRGLVKSIADFKDADAETYLRQAHAILSEDKTSSAGTSHPELYIRAKALANRAAMDQATFEASLVPLIEGMTDIDNLDIFGQKSLQDQTVTLINAYTRHSANRSESILAHAKHFDPKFRWPTKATEILFAVPGTTVETRDYFSYVLLDLATCDPERIDDGLATALVIAKECDLATQFRKIARKELKKTTTELSKYEQHGEKLLGVTGHA